MAGGRVAIVGGGVAGLALGHALATRAAGPDVLVFESQPRPGGIVCTEKTGGFLFEHGPSGFLDNAPDTLALAHDLGLADRLIASDDRARRRFVCRKGRLREVPSSPASLFTSGVLSALGLLRLAAEPLVRRRPEGDESIHAFTARRLGVEAADVLADSIASGVFGGDARQLSLGACFPSVPDMEARHGSLLKAMLNSRRERHDPPPRRGRLTSFRDGLEELTGALARRLNTRLHTSHGVQRLRPAAQGGGYVLTLADGRAVGADAVVLAGGADASARLLADFDRSLASALAEIPSAPIVTVGLGYEVAAIGRKLDGFGFLAPRQSGVRLLGVLWESSIFAGRAPAGHALLRVMLGGATDADAVDLDDERLLARVRAELRTTMQVNGTPRWVRVVRHRVGIPQYVIGHTDRLARIEAALASHPGLFVAGHAFRGVGVNACIADAGPLADRVLASLTGRAAA